MIVALLLAMLAAGCYGPLDRSGPSPSAQRRHGPIPGQVTIQRGDTVYGISRHYGLPLRSVIEANDLEPPYVIHVGETLRLPRARYHVVEKGDTIYNIARRYDIQQSQLTRLNGIRTPYTIHVGEKLVLPAPTIQSAGTNSAGSAAKPAVRLPGPGQRSGKGFLWPVQGKIISTFGPKASGLHNDGINIAAPRGAVVRAADNGIVAYAGNELRGFGKLLLLKHDHEWMSAYAHNDALLVSRGQHVMRGQPIARVGSSGNVVTPQLHFELRHRDRPVDPLSIVNGAGTAGNAASAQSARR